MNEVWSNQNKKFQSLLKKNTFSEGILALCDLRNILMEDMLSWKDQLSVEEYSAMPFMNANGYHSKSVAYSLWHIFRIEDIVLNTLILNREQVLFRKDFLKRMQAPIQTTGNELVKEEIEKFSKQLDIDVLYEYILCVKEESDVWLQNLQYEDLKQSFDDKDIQRLHDTACVSEAESAVWLIDYWCSKDVKGLLKMPFSRHWIMHVEAANRIIHKMKK